MAEASHLQRRLPAWRSTGLEQSCSLTLRDSSSGGALRGSRYMRPVLLLPPPPDDPCDESATLPRLLPFPPLVAASLSGARRIRNAKAKRRIIVRDTRYPPARSRR